MDFGQSIQTCMTKYADFDGRASRSEYWWFYLFTLLMSWGASIVGLTLGDTLGSLLSLLVNLALFLPSLGAMIRRLHDTNRAGWWCLIALTIIGIIPLIIFLVMESDKGPNDYGDAPLA